MYDDYDDYDNDEYRPNGVEIIGPIGGPPFGQQFPMGGPPFGQQPPFGGPPFGQQPPFGGPPFGQPPFGGGGFGQSGAPSGPPPAFMPNQSMAGPSLFKVDPGSIRPCRFRFVFLWLRNGRSFWAWLTFVGRNSVAGWRWNGFRWVYFGVDLDEIVSFYCY